jgi:hypothetical protein
LVAISAASAEVVRPATISKGKATRFITSPFVIPCRQTGGFDASTCKPNPCDNPHNPTCAVLKVPKFFNFVTKPPRSNRGQMPPFYAFVGKPHTLSNTVAVGIQLICESLIRSGELFYSPRHMLHAERARTYIGRRGIKGRHSRSRADEGDSRRRGDCRQRQRD